MQRLVRAPTANWKLTVAVAVCEYVLAAPNVHIKGAAWSIDNMHAALLAFMMVTGATLEQSDADVKGRADRGAKGVSSLSKIRGLASLEECHFSRARREEGAHGSRVEEVSESDVGLGTKLDRSYSNVGVRRWRRPTQHLCCPNFGLRSTLRPTLPRRWPRPM